VGQQASVQANRWTTLTATALGLTELNQGVAGTLLQHSTFINSAPGVAQVNNGRDRFVAALLGASQRMRTFVAYGLNDYCYVGGLGTDGSGTGCTLALYQSNLREVLNGLIAQGMRPGDIVLVGPYWMTDTGLGSGTAGFVMTTNLGSVAAARAQANAFIATALAVAVEYGTLYVDGAAAMSAIGAGAVGTDNIHPNDTGYAAIAAAAKAPVVANSKAAPIGVTAAKSASGAMTVTWTAPPLVGGVTVMNYTVDYGLKSSTGATPFTMTGDVTVSALTNTFTGLADGWYVARVKANYSDSTSSPWAWFIAGAAVDSRTTDTTVISTDFRTATVGANVESISPWTKLAT
jgi:lysophospholipase L1-like esterase